MKKSMYRFLMTGVMAAAVLGMTASATKPGQVIPQRQPPQQTAALQMKQHQEMTSDFLKRRPLPLWCLARQAAAPIWASVITVKG